MNRPEMQGARRRPRPDRWCPATDTSTASNEARGCMQAAIEQKVTGRKFAVDEAPHALAVRRQCGCRQRIRE